jgi:hypothetical protein
MNIAIIKKFRADVFSADYASPAYAGVIILFITIIFLF